MRRSANNPWEACFLTEMKWRSGSNGEGTWEGVLDGEEGGETSQDIVYERQINKKIYKK